MNQLIESVDSETGEVTSYTYDEYGNLANDGTYEYLYDSYNYNRLWSTSNIKTKKHVLYDYYYDCLRKSKGNTFYIWLDGNMVYEFTSSGSDTYTYGNRLLYSDSSKYVLNAHGDVVALLDAAGSVTKRYDYDAFGNELNIDSADTNPFRYCAEYFDKEYGQIYLRNRYYLPVVGRFTQLDPIKDGLNWYAYCGNNPVRHVDPTGESFEDALYGFIEALDENNTDGAAAWFAETVLGSSGYRLNDSDYDYYYGRILGNIVSAIAGGIEIGAGVGTIISTWLGGGTVTIGSGGTLTVAGAGVISAGTVEGTIMIGVGANTITVASASFYSDYDNLKKLSGSRLTTPEATEIAKKLGYEKTKVKSHGQPVYYNKKTKTYITPDVDLHNGGVWKMADSVKNLGSRKTRMGTYDLNLNRIGD